MPRFFEKTFLALLLSFSVLAIGCETTDYQPLIMKKKLKEMQAEIDALKEEVSELKKSGVSAAPKTSDSSTTVASDAEGSNAASVAVAAASSLSVEDEAEAREAPGKWMPISARPTTVQHRS